MLTTQFGTDARSRNSTLAPALDAEGKPKRGVLLPVLDFAQPTGAGCGQAKLNSTLRQCEAALGANRRKGHGSRCSNRLNMRASDFFQIASTDLWGVISHDVNMAAPSKHDWYLREWFATLGLKQRDLATKLDYQTQTAFNLWHSIQPYRRDHVEAISALLNIQPFELLMPPEEAMALRRMRATLAEVARAEAPALSSGDETPRTGTDG